MVKKKMNKYKSKENRSERVLLIGKSECGKTYHSKTILENELNFIPKQNRFLISPTSKKILDNQLIPYFDEDCIFKKFDKSDIEAIIELIEEVRIETYDKHYYKYVEDENGYIEKIKKKNVTTEPQYEHFLLFLDDCIQYLRNTFIAELITYARHFNLSIIITTQVYKKLNPNIRINSTQLKFFGCNNSELEKLCDEWSEFSRKKTFKKYFRYITQEPYSYFTINDKYRHLDKYNDNKITAKEFIKKLKNNEIEIDDDDEDI